MHILIVEGSRRERRKYRNWAAHLSAKIPDLEVTYCVYAVEASNVLKAATIEEPVDVVITDIIIPLGGGFQIIRTLAEYPDPPYLYINSDQDYDGIGDMLERTTEGRVEYDVPGHRIQDQQEFSSIVNKAQEFMQARLS